MSRDPNKRLGVTISVLGVVLLMSCGGASHEDSADVARSTTSSGAPTIQVKLSDAGCDPNSFSIHPGSVVFSVTNTGSTKVKEMEIADAQGHVRGDVEGVAPGQTRTFVVDLKPGTYQVRCPQNATTSGTLTVA